MAVVVTDGGESYIAARLQASAGAPTYFVGVGTGATAASKTSTTLSTEVETRAAMTPTLATQQSTNDTVDLVGTQTMGSARVITNAGVLTASSAGTLLVMSDGLSISLGAGDSVQNTFRWQQT